MIRKIVAWELQSADAMMFHVDVDLDIFSEAAEFLAELQRQTQERVLVQALRLIVDGSPVGFVCNNTRDEFHQTELEHESQDELLCFLTTSSPIIDDFTARSNARCFYRFREGLYEELDVDDYGLPIAVSSPAVREDHTERWTRHIVDVKCEIYRLHPEEVERNLRRNPVSLPPSQRSGPPAPPPMMRAISQWELTPVMVYYRDPDARDRLAQHVTLPPADTAVEGFHLIVEAEDAGYVALHVRSRFQFLLDVLAPVAPLSFTTTPHQDISIPVAERYFLLYRGRLYEVDERGYKDEGVGMEVIELGEDDAPHAAHGVGPAAASSRT